MTTVLFYEFKSRKLRTKDNREVNYSTSAKKKGRVSFNFQHSIPSLDQFSRLTQKKHDISRFVQG